jgi:uncharacterized protein (TIGR04255 family)
MKFNIRPAEIKKLLKGVGASKPAPEESITISACAARVFVEYKGDVGGIEHLVLADGAVTLPAKKLVDLLSTYKGVKSLHFEGGPKVLKVDSLTMPIIRWEPNPKPPADFQIFPVTDTTITKTPKPTRSSESGGRKPLPLPKSSVSLPIPERLPKRIEPCPIVEAAVELRFVSTESWRNLPGLLSPRLRERYPQESELPLAQIPERIRQQEAIYTYQALLQYEGPEFLIRFGPRVLTLITRTHQYPGWQRFREELTWLWKTADAAGFVQEGERLGLRYVDFFSQNIFSLVVLGVSVAGRELAGLEQSFSVVVPWDESTARLVLANGAFLNDGRETQRGSILDLDVWQQLASEDVFPDALSRIENLHDVNKKLFFGLLKPEFLATLKPIY